MKYEFRKFTAFRRRWSKSSPASSFSLVYRALIRFLPSLCCVFHLLQVLSSGSDDVDICGYSSVAAYWNCSFLWGFMRACTCASLTFQLSLFTRMLCALGFRSLIFNRRWPSHPLNKRYAVPKVDGSSASLVSVNLDALSNLPPDCSLQPNHILGRVLSMKRSLSDTPVPPVLVHRCLVARYPYVSTNDPSFVDKAFPIVDVLTCDKTIPPSSSIKHYKSSSAQSSSAVWYPSNVSLRSGWSMTDVSPSSFTAWAKPMENIQNVSPSSSPAFVGKSSSISSSSSCEEKRLPLYLLSVKGAKVSVSSPSSLFSLNTILLSCVAVSTGPEYANENTSGFPRMFNLLLSVVTRTFYFNGSDVPWGSAPGKTDMHGLIMESSKDICSLFDSYLPNHEASTHEITWRMFSTQLWSSLKKNQINGVHM
ncbi:hypothetical protein DY000_02056172 [Brassica cretica]|uniref:Uncharacterized protein n=1 Tax=Brassica cretica TaxID=69181 RepID=A0ABQ7AES2_BRACR|nr:hypothetical protein DY000_02056172 [Brassica cretica]